MPLEISARSAAPSESLLSSTEKRFRPAHPKLGIGTKAATMTGDCGKVNWRDLLVIYRESVCRCLRWLLGIGNDAKR